MPEKSTTPHLVELVNHSVDAANGRDFAQFAGFAPSRTTPTSTRPVLPPNASLRNGLMAEQPAVPDVAELTRRIFDAASCHDLDEALAATGRLGEKGVDV
jgi:hypothetical protein